MSEAHKPVLCTETIEYLLQTYTGGGVFVDATYGRGGHARALLARLSVDAQLIVLDRDPDAFADACLLAKKDPRVIALHGKFSQIGELIRDRFGEIDVTGAMMDLGVSSPQLDTPERGFSFRFDGPLDMRMDPTSGVSAAEWLNTAREADIARVLKDFGEERHARRIARSIVDARPLHTTTDLKEAVGRTMPRSTKGKHDATRVFQAVRIYVNAELDEIAEGMQQLFALLAKGGRLGVISFHSLEDRVVKRFFKALSQPPALPRRLPVRDDQAAAPARLIAGPLRPGLSEERANKRARSAILRVVERVEEKAA
ncbi:MAG: 16S rRNA (cytosine(1402)-N(4))-methyltransferase RsmH [Proteobacteria bacterium]|nr:16S rRNA (cytosine(1402)-N(4))-methyltransferase RsmH [Pseudomonadota bacterium]